MDFILNKKKVNSEHRERYTAIQLNPSIPILIHSLCLTSSESHAVGSQICLYGKKLCLDSLIPLSIQKYENPLSIQSLCKNTWLYVTQ